MKLIILIFFLISGNLFAQECNGVIKVTDNIGRVDSVIFGRQANASIIVDTAFNEFNLYGLPYDSLEIRSVLRDTMCALLWFSYDQYIYYYYLMEEYNVNDFNIDLKIDIRDYSLSDPYYSSYTFFVNALEFPVLVEVKQFVFPPFNNADFIVFDSTCNALQWNHYLDYQFSTIDTFYIITGPEIPNFRIYVDFWNNVDEKYTSKNFEIYPNPAHERLEIITNSDEFDIEIININGEIVLQRRKSRQIDLSDFQPGIYYVRLNNDKVSENKKIVIY